MTLFKKALTATASALLLAGLVTSAAAYEAGKTYKFSVLHVNDTHGHFWVDEQGQGGFAAIKTIYEQVKKEQGAENVLFFHAGDFNTGVPESDTLKAAPDIEGMNLVGFDAVAVGNHEFDVGLAGIEVQKKALKMPYLSANISYKDPKSGVVTEHFFTPYTFFKKGGLSYLVVGTTTPSTKYQSNPENTAPFTFTDPAEAFQKAVADSEKKNGKADVVISLSHLGYYPLGQHKDNPYGDITLAQKLPAGSVNMFIGGHTHIFGCVEDGRPLALSEAARVVEKCTPEVVSGAPVVEAAKWGEFVGRADFEFKDGKVTYLGYRMIPVNAKLKSKDANGKSVYTLLGKEVAQDPDVEKALKPFYDEGQKSLSVKVGTLTADMEASRLTRTPLAYLIAEAFREITNSDFSIMNSGGVRASLSAGDLTYKNILTVMPFHNTLVTVKMTAKEVVDYLKAAAAMEQGSGAYANFAGVTFDYDPNTKEVSNVKIGGKDLEEGKTYQYTTLSFMAKGGDKYPDISSSPSYVDTGYNDAKAFVDYLKANPVIDPAKIVIEGPNKK